jgi:4-carboxymuconolactone decarboxylase
VSGPGEDLLRRLSAADDSAAAVVLALPAEPGGGATAYDAALTTKVRMLVTLAALLALDASTTSIRWAVELASCAGADIDEIARVLVTIAPDVGVAQVVNGAPRLALAVGFDVDIEGWDGA